MGCGTKDLKTNIGFTYCDQPLVKGIDETIFLGRFAWLDSSSASNTQKKIINAILLKTGLKLLRYKGQNYSNQLTAGFAAGEYGNTVPQGLRFIAFTSDPDEEAELDALIGLNDVFAIVKRNGNPGSYKIAGWKTGLRVTNLTSDSNDDTLKGAYVIELSAPDEKTTFYTFKHMSSGNPSVDDTATYLDSLALAVAA